MGWIEWVLGIVAAVISGTVIYMGKLFNDLPKEYMPREQINDRFEGLQNSIDALDNRIHADMELVERRTDRQLDKLDRKLDQILSKLDGKADK